MSPFCANPRCHLHQRLVPGWVDRLCSEPPLRPAGPLDASAAVPLRETRRILWHGPPPPAPWPPALDYPPPQRPALWLCETCSEAARLVTGGDLRSWVPDPDLLHEIARSETEQALRALHEAKRADADRAWLEIAQQPVPRCEDCGKPSPRRINVGEADGDRKVCEDCFTLYTGYG